MKKIKAAVVGYGNIGHYTLQALQAAPDFEIVGIVRRRGAEDCPEELKKYAVVKDIRELEKPDVAILCTPTRSVEAYAKDILALGINNYFTGIGSPVTDYADMGVFCVNGNEEIGKLIADNTPFRGMVLTGGVQDTCNEIMAVVTGLHDGSMASGTVTNATTLFVNEDTVEEYLSTGNVVSVTEDDF